MPWRILVFYVGTLFVIMSIYPWNQVGTNGSPFVLTFQHMGITVAAGILNFVVITASLSAINSDVFGVGRMLRHGRAGPRAEDVQQGVETRHSLGDGGGDDAGAAAGGISQLHHAGERVPGDRVLATFATVWVWIMILFSQIAFRRSLSKEQVKQLAFPLRGGVFTSVVAIVFLVFIIGLIGYFPTTRVSLYAGLVWVVLLLAGYWFKVNHQKNARRWRRSKTKWKNTAEPVFLALSSTSSSPAARASIRMSPPLRRSSSSSPAQRAALRECPAYCC